MGFINLSNHLQRAPFFVSSTSDSTASSQSCLQMRRLLPFNNATFLYPTRAAVKLFATLRVRSTRRCLISSVFILQCLYNYHPFIFATIFCFLTRKSTNHHCDNIVAEFVGSFGCMILGSMPIAENAAIGIVFS